MITGYNHNIPHNGRTYHIQTEDSGLQHPHIITHLFVGGNIIHSKKRSYSHLLESNLHENEKAFEIKLREMMKAQHKEMLKELKAGTHDHVGTQKSAGALLTPGLLAISEASGEGAGVEADEPALASPPDPEVGALTPPPLDALQMAWPTPPPGESAEAIGSQADGVEATEDAQEESATSSSRGGLRGRGSRLSRERPDFPSPPPESAASAASAASERLRNDNTAPDLPAFDESVESTSNQSVPRRKLRAQRGSGRGKRPELQLQPPSSRMTPTPASFDSTQVTPDVGQTAESVAPSFALREVVQAWLQAPETVAQIWPSSEHSDAWAVTNVAKGRVTPTPRTDIPAGSINKATLSYLKTNK